MYQGLWTRIEKVIDAATETNHNDMDELFAFMFSPKQAIEMRQERMKKEKLNQMLKIVGLGTVTIAEALVLVKRWKSR